jgi:hypothetical protein
MTAILFLILLPIYFLPSIIAGARSKVNGTAGVVLLNLFLGWTLIGWVGAFIWAFTGRTAADEARELKQHREMIAAIASTKEAK